MASYVITGASRGIGFEFLRQLSSNPSNTVIGVVRNKAATEPKVAELGRSNIHIVEGDLDSYESLKKAADATAKITGGSLDYLIANGALLPTTSGFLSMSEQGADDPIALEKELAAAFKTNVIGNVHLFNVFLPLILKGQVKKVITISSGMGDIEMPPKIGLYESGPYSVSKAAVNSVVAKYSAEYQKDGVLFIAICPGMVDTGHFEKLFAEVADKAATLFGKFASMATSNFTGAASPESSVKDVISVYEKASVANGDGGSFVSHFGNKTWL